MDLQVSSEVLKGLETDIDDLKLKEETEHLASDLVQRCHVLLDELEQFQRYLAEQKKSKEVELRHFKTNIKTELKSLQKVISYCSDCLRLNADLR